MSNTSQIKLKAQDTTFSRSHTNQNQNQKGTNVHLSVSAHFHLVRQKRATVKYLIEFPNLKVPQLKDLTCTIVSHEDGRAECMYLFISAKIQNLYKSRIWSLVTNALYALSPPTGAMTYLLTPHNALLYLDKLLTASLKNAQNTTRHKEIILGMARPITQCTDHQVPPPPRI